jgi:hypothetical protein
MMMMMMMMGRLAVETADGRLKVGMAHDGACVIRWKHESA